MKTVQRWRLSFIQVRKLRFWEHSIRYLTIVVARGLHEERDIWDNGIGNMEVTDVIVLCG